MNRFNDFHCGQRRFSKSILGTIDQKIAAESALRHVTAEIPQLKSKLYSIKQDFKNILDYNLSTDEAVAIYLCGENSDYPRIHQTLNDVLRTENVEEIKPWSRYLALLYTGLNKLPSKKGEVWRGIDIELAKTLKEGDVFSWWTISSCCSSKKSIRRHLLDKTVPYSIEIFDGKNIPRFASGGKDIDEIILFPGARVRVERCSYDSSTDKYDIHLIQVADDDSEFVNESASNIRVNKQSRSQTKLGIDSGESEVDQEILLEIKFNDGSLYQVNRRRGKRKMNTVFITKAGKTYENEEADRQANGEGKRKWLNGDQYNGRFINGKRSGHGTLRCSDGYTYIGDWSEDEMHGQGTSTWPNGSRYVGNHTHGRITGEGRMNTPNGDSYVGDLLDGKAHGRGNRIWANGDEYKGGFENDRKHGQGTYFYADCSQYSGDWVNDQMHGKGTLKWSSGSQYKGEFRKGQRHGQGEFISTDGRILKGEWKKDQFIAS